MRAIVTFCFGALLVAACGSSSTNERASTADAGLHATVDANGDVTAKCSPFGSPNCNIGEVCCWNGVTGSCVAVGACASPIQVECWGPDRCKADEVCCGRFVPAFASSVPNAASPDGAVDPTATVLCEKTCPEPSVVLCRSQADCRGEGRCTAVPEGGNQGALAIAAEIILVCAPPDAGAL